MLKYFKMTRKEQVIWEESLRPMPDVYFDVNEILKFPLGYLRDAVYEPSGGTLRLQMLQSNKMEAYATSVPGDEIDHIIVISYPMVAAIWRDCVSFSVYAKHLFGIDNEDGWKKILGLYASMGRGLDPDSRILPKGYHTNYTSHQMYTLGAMWLFHHEASHLLQNHGYIRNKARQNSGDANDAFEISEFYARDNGNILSDKESWIWHVTELAADYEATASTLTMLEVQLMQAAASRKHDAASELWLLFVAIALIFLRFWEINKKPFTSQAQGTHPHPGIRYYMVVRTVNDVIAKSGSILNSLSIKRRIAIADDAFVSAGLFWIHRYDADSSIKESFADVVIGEAPGIMDYLAQVEKVWTEVKIDAITNHLRKDVKILLEFDWELMREFRSRSCDAT